MARLGRGVSPRAADVLMGVALSLLPTSSDIPIIDKLQPTDTDRGELQRDLPADAVEPDHRDAAFREQRSGSICAGADAAAGDSLFAHVEPPSVRAQRYRRHTDERHTRSYTGRREPLRRPAVGDTQQRLVVTPTSASLLQAARSPSPISPSPSCWFSGRAYDAAWPSQRAWPPTCC